MRGGIREGGSLGRRVPLSHDSGVRSANLGVSDTLPGADDSGLRSTESRGRRVPIGGCLITGGLGNDLPLIHVEDSAVAGLRLRGAGLRFPQSGLGCRQSYATGAFAQQNAAPGLTPKPFRIRARGQKPVNADCSRLRPTKAARSSHQGFTRTPSKRPSSTTAPAKASTIRSMVMAVLRGKYRLP